MSLLDKARNKKQDDFKPADVQFGGKDDKPGDGVEGVITRVSSKPNKFKPEATDYIIALKLDDGREGVVFASRTVLRREAQILHDEGLLVAGNRFAAVYIGTEAVKSGAFAGTQTHVYRAVAEAANGAASNDDDALPF